MKRFYNETQQNETHADKTAAVPTAGAPGEVATDGQAGRVELSTTSYHKNISH
jgi:hypothetical protein